MPSVPDPETVIEICFVCIANNFHSIAAMFLISNFAAAFVHGRVAGETSH